MREVTPKERAKTAAALARKMLEELTNAVEGLEQALATPNVAEENGPLSSFEFEIERIERAAQAWNRVGPIQPDTWAIIAAEMLLDDARTVLPTEYEELDVEERKKLAEAGADAIKRAVGGDVQRLAKIPRDAWRDALVDWRRETRSRKGRPKSGTKSRGAVLWELLKPAGLAENIATQKNLVDVVTQAKRAKEE